MIDDVPCGLNYSGKETCSVIAVTTEHTNLSRCVKYIHYWFNEDDGAIFCLSEAPNKEAAEAVHREAHGLMADEIIEVKEGH